MTNRIKTKKYIKKQYYKNLLVKAGYKVFSAYRRTHIDLYIMLIIACNKINKDNPDNAFYNILQAYNALTQGKECRPELWKVPQVKDVVNEDTDTQK